jgi:hypothetical protein
MTTDQKAVLARFTRIRQFLDRHGREVAPVNQSRARKDLDELVHTLRAEVAGQRTTIEKGRRLLAERRALRETLWSVHLRPIVAVARARGAKSSQLAHLVVPRPGTAETLVGIEVKVIANIIGEHRQLFLAEGFPEDFVQRLLDAAQAVYTARMRYFACGAECTRATFAIAQALERGTRLVSILRALVLERLGKNPRLAAEWRAIVRVKA